MGYLVKGWPGITVVSIEPAYDVGNNARTIDVLYQGSVETVLGIEWEVQQSGLSYSTTQDGPIMSMHVRYPAQDPSTVDPTRYEIESVSEAKSIWEYLPVLAATEAYDAARPLTNNLPTHKPLRQQIEELVDGQRFSISPPVVGVALGAYVSIVADVIRNLKGGVSGFQVDYLVLRRFRKIDITFGFSNAGRMALDSGGLIYSTEQLNLPDSVAFTMPATPTVDAAQADLFGWGWRRVSQNVAHVGWSIEQQIALQFAPWSKLFYTASDTNLDW